MAEIKGSKILIAGFGEEGKSVLEFLKVNHKNAEVAVCDKNPETVKGLDLKVFSGEKYLDSIDKFDTVVRSPGIPLELFSKAKHVTSLTNIFFENCPGKVIAVTGTKGKSTTATLIYELIKTKYDDVRLTGNIGVASLNSLKGSDNNTLFVYEISSFQLEDIRYSPHVAVLLAITSDHIDRHGSLENYIKAKQNIVKYQSSNDLVFFIRSDANAAKVAKSSKAKKVAVYPKKISYKTNLLGRGNDANVSMATSVAKHFEIDQETIKKIVSEFSPLPHRIEKVGVYKKITFYDDSIATNPSASINSIEALEDNLDTVIIGGANKGFDFKDYVAAVSDFGIKNIILMPDTGYQMEGEFKRLNKSSSIFKASTMKQAVELAYKHTSPKRSCLLSPAATSFNMFKDYKERGEVFKKLIEELGQ